MSSTSSVSTTIQGALTQTSHLNLEALYSAGIKLKEIQKVADSILREDSSNNDLVKSNMEFIKDWTSKHKKSPEKSLLNDVFHSESTQEAQEALEFFLEAGGSAKKIVRYLSETPFPSKAPERVTFLANLRVTAEIDMIAPKKKKSFRKKIDFHESLVNEWNRHASDFLQQPDFLSTMFDKSKKGLLGALINSPHHTAILEQLFKGDTEKLLPFYIECGGNAEALAEFLVKSPQSIEMLDKVRIVLKHAHSQTLLDEWKKRAAPYFTNYKELLKIDNQKELVALFIDYQNPLDKKISLLYKASNNKDIKGVENLLNMGANPNLATISGYTPLHLAAKLGDQDMMELLLTHKANINIKTNAGISPLMWAIQHKQLDFALALVAKGAALNTLDNKRNSPLSFALAFADSTDFTKKLIELGADPLAKELLGGKSPWSTAITGRWQFALQAYFGDYPLITQKCKDITENKRIIFIRCHAEELLEPTSDSPTVTPLEIAFLLEDPRIASTIIKGLARKIQDGGDPNAIENAISYLKKKYPHSSFELIDHALRAVPEASYEVVKAHILPVSELTAVEFPSNDTPDISLDKLSELLERVLAIKEGEPGYRDLTLVRDANGETFTAEQLREKMGLYISHIKTRYAKPGTPPAENSEQLETWYLLLERCAKHVIVKLEEEAVTADDPVPYAPSLFELAIAGGNCGGWNMGDTQKIYQQKCQSDFPDLEKQILLELYTIHQSIIESMVNRDHDQNTHRFNMFAQVVDKSAGISAKEKQSRFYFLDHITPKDRKEVKPEILYRFWGNYEPTTLIDALEHTFNSGNIDRDLIIDWFKEHTPETWRQETYQKALSSVEKLDSSKAQLSALLKDHDILIQLMPSIETQVDKYFIKKKEPEKYNRALQYIGAYRNNVDKAIVQLKKIGINAVKGTPLLEQVGNFFLNQLTPVDKNLYNQINNDLKNLITDKEKAEYLQNKHQIHVLVPKTLAEELDAVRRIEFLSEIIGDDGRIQRKAIIYLLETLGAIKRRKNTPVDKPLFIS